MKTTIRLIITILPLLCMSIVGPKAQAVLPPPDGGYPNFNTAEGQNALFGLTTAGAANTAVGWYSLFSDADGSFNTAVGAGSLLFNVSGANNTAIGAAALLFNTGSHNTAVGAGALVNNIDDFNTAVGEFALNSNTSGTSNTADGYQVLLSNTDGSYNTANGYSALYANTTGSFNTAIGAHALINNTGGFSNTAVGYNAGFNLTTGSGNVCIGDGVEGVDGESDTTRIRNIYSSVASERIVYVNSDNKIGTLASSRRFKEEIKSMEKASEVLFALKPVSFRYKKEFDTGRALMFGLIAEDVEQVDPNLVSRNEKGEVETVRYHQINAMLLNEFLKEHRKVEKLEASVADLAAQLQKVSAQVEMNKPGAQVAVIER